MSVLFDTNGRYSAFTSKGVCEDIVNEAAGGCVIIWSQPLQAELETTLRRKYKLDPGTHAALASFVELCEFVVPAALPKPLGRDSDDDVVLATALAAKANFIVTGDNDLLGRKEFHGIRPPPVNSSQCSPHDRPSSFV